MKLSVIGCGYLGAVHAAAMASLGYEVVGIDTDSEKVAALSGGRAPFFEPGLNELIREQLSAKRLSFSTDPAAATNASIHFLCVGTPESADGSAADLAYVNSAIESLLSHLAPGDIVVGKSTVPVGTAAVLAERVGTVGAHLAWNPEFLREGWAITDTVAPDRVVFGVPEGAAGAEVERTLREVYREVLTGDTPCVVTDYATAELVKVAANAFLATKISFINAMAEIAEVVNADVTLLADALGHDARIGRRYLGSGIGFGGGCLPKDIRAFAARAEELGRRDSVSFLHEIDAINLRRRARAVQLVLEALDGVPLGKKIAVLGASFKPFSDDTRDSPALDVATQLHGLGARVVVTDPQAIDNARRVHPQLTYETDLDTALSDADAVLIVTEWNEYRHGLDPEHVGSLVRTRTVIDGRNCLDPKTWHDSGWEYRGMGRPQHT